MKYILCKTALVILCLLGANFSIADNIEPVGRGCCSWHGGVCGCSNGRDRCCDGSLSPSCTCYSPRPTSRPVATPTTIPTSKLSLRPSKKLTPGAHNEMTETQLCESKVKEPRISASLKNKVAARYKVKSKDGWTVDLLVPVCLGGTTDIKNLWPQSTSGKWNYAKKNILEKELYRRMCEENYYLDSLREILTTDWIGLGYDYFQALASLTQIKINAPI